MGNLEKRLREDADEIRVDVSDELSRRLRASVCAAERPAASAQGSGHGFSLWWLASLTGVAAAIVGIALLNLADVRAPEAPDEAPMARVVPDELWQLQSAFPLRAETAALTEPLEEELENLKADFERARDNLEADLKATV